jgi:DNA-binding MarR family transcriptional regulator
VTQIRWDRERETRTGVPEVVYGPGKTSAHLRQIFEDTTELRIASRLSDEQMQVLSDVATIHREARMAVRNGRPSRNMPVVPVLTAGTADIPVALEAATTLEAMGVPTAKHFDVGVAGIRLTDLAAKAQLSLAATSELVSQLQGLGYLERRPDARDRRAKLIFPTRRGLRALEDAGDRVAEIEQYWAQIAGPKRFDAACRTMQDLLDALTGRDAVGLEDPMITERSQAPRPTSRAG